jgi:outer membrane lipoprotein-sorting protein
VVPAGALAVTGGVMAAALMPAAQASPALPARTAAQLIADVAAQSHVPAHSRLALSGTVVETASLGLPRLPGTQSPTSVISMLTGSHTFSVWFASPRQYRIALPGSMTETDIYRNGDTAWLWQSVSDSVTKFVLPANASTQAPAPLPVTPQQAASDALAAVGPTTTVSVDRNAYVAGQAAYELVLAPKDSRSLVGQVRIAIDASNSMPLRVEVFARHATSPAISVGFTSITFTAPSAADLTFTPPSGAKVSTVNGPADHAGTSDHGNGTPGGTGVIGSGWLTVLKLPSSVLTSAPGGSSAYSSKLTISGGPGESAAALQALLGSATVVHGAWGSGRLIHTSLVSVLITDQGRVYVGAVDPSVLYAAAAQP